ncbi:2'-5' RNA ligase family protein [Allokutzneria oryzae]|uniref:2'-5' RNA ligase family protein n=1 Tax=Allokutzneria oryzae TaxID=1378989 RepID=A0ABV5ZND1_9PSEU
MAPDVRGPGRATSSGLRVSGRLARVPLLGPHPAAMAAPDDARRRLHRRSLRRRRSAHSRSRSKRLANMGPVTLTFHRPVVFEEAIVLPPTPADAVHRIRATIREAIADVWGPDRVPESEHAFRAHVSAAYINAESPATSITDALSALDTESASAKVSAASLITLGRDEHVYTWRAFATAPLAR